MPDFCHPRSIVSDLMLSLCSRYKYIQYSGNEYSYLKRKFHRGQNRVINRNLPVFVQHLMSELKFVILPELSVLMYLSHGHSAEFRTRGLNHKCKSAQMTPR